MIQTDLLKLSQLEIIAYKLVALGDPVDLRLSTVNDKKFWEITSYSSNLAFQGGEYFWLFAPLASDKRDPVFQEIATWETAQEALIAWGNYLNKELYGKQQTTSDTGESTAGR